MRTIALGTLSVLLLSASCTAEAPDFEASYAPDGLEIILPDVDAVSAGSPVQAMVATRGPIGEVAAISAENLPTGATLSDRGDGSALFMWTPVTSQVGKHTIDISAESAKHQLSQTWSLTVTTPTGPSTDVGGGGDEAVNSPPVLTSGLEYWLFSGVPYELALGAYDADGDSVAVSLSLADPGISLMYAPLRLIATVVASGLYSATLLLDDGNTQVSTTVWFHMQPQGNLPPRFATFSSDVTLPGGSPWSLPILTEDPNGDPVALSVNGPAGMTITDGMLEWTPPFHGFGSATVTLTASDGATAVTHAFDVHVDDAPNSAPVLQHIAAPSAYQGAFINFEVTAIDPENDGVTFSLGATAPPAATITAGGTIEWTVPSSQSVGPATIPVIASDSYGAAATTAYAVYVNLNTPPIIYATRLGNAARYTAYSKAVRAEDFDFGQSMTLSLVTAPTGMTLSRTATTTYTLAWHPTVHNGFIDVGLVAEDQHGVRAYHESRVYVPNGSPELTVGFPDNQACIGTPKAFSLSASDPDGDPLGFSGTGDVVFHGTPVSGGTAYFTGMNVEDTGTLTLFAEDGFGGLGLTDAAFRIRGFREEAGFSNRISELDGSKVSLAVTGHQTGAAFLWRNSTTQQKIHQRLIGANGCPTDGINEPMIYDPVANGATFKGANTGRIHIQNDIVISTFTIYGQPSWGYCGAAHENKYVTYVRARHLTDGSATFQCLFIPSSTASDTAADQSDMSFTASNATSVLHCTKTFSTNTLYCRLMNAEFDAGIATLSLRSQFTHGNVTKQQWATAHDGISDYFITWRDASSGYLRMVGRGEDNTQLFAGSVATLTNEVISHPHVAALGAKATVHLYEKGNDLWLVPVSALPAAGTGLRLDDRPTGFAGEIDLKRVPGSNRVIAVWAHDDAIYLQATDYDSLGNKLVSAWGQARLLIEQSPNLRSLRLLTLNETLAVAWLEEGSSGVYRPVVRYLNPQTGGFVSNKLYITTRTASETAFTDFFVVGNGVGVSWLKDSHVYTEWRGADGSGRPTAP